MRLSKGPSLRADLIRATRDDNAFATIYALALSRAATDFGIELERGRGDQVLSCSRLVALTIGAVIDFLCISQASAT